MKKYSLVYIYILIILLMIGCGDSSEKTELQHPDRSPESLADVSSGLDDIGSSLDQIERTMMNISSMEEKAKEEIPEMPETSETQEELSEEENQSGGGEEENGSQQSQQTQQSQQPEEPKKTEEEIKNEKIENSWQEIEKKVEEIHSNWNEYEVDAQKKGVTREQLDSFQNALNKMTLSIEEKNATETYNEISQVYLALRPIFDYYQDEIMGELTNLKYDIYKSYAMGIKDSQESNFEILETNEDLYNKIRHKLDDESKNDLIDRLEYSVTSLKKGLREDSRRVNMINKKVVLDNIKELEN